MQKLGREILVIVITHSQEVIQGMENIYIMDSGKCIWHGSYESLAREKQLKTLLNEG
jgi:ABC-type transport system involved in cytochrome bd biosynthesis fused ATPase/permease subunit